MESRKPLEILISEPEFYSPSALDILSSIGNVTLNRLPLHTLDTVIPEYDILVVRLGLKIDRRFLTAARRLQYIVSPTTGLDHIDGMTAEQNGIIVISLKGEEAFLRTIPSTAEHTWALLLSMLRNIPAASEDVKKGNWNRDKFRGHNLMGKKLGILGLGRVGSQVSIFADAFKMQIAAFDPYQQNWQPGLTRFFQIEELLAWCDILTIHIPNDTRNEKYLDRQKLSILKPGALVVNTSRAGVWDEQAVLELLLNKHLGGVASDVLSNELDISGHEKNPMIEYAKSHGNLLITPHLGGATVESMEQTEVFIAEKLKRTIQSVKSAGMS